MNTTKIYHLTEKGLEEGEALGRISVVLKSDYDALKAEMETERKFRLSAEGGWREDNRVIAMHRAKLDEQEAELTKARELIADEIKRSHLTSLPLKISFADQYGYESVEEVHKWMSNVSSRMKEFLAPPTS